MGGGGGGACTGCLSGGSGFGIGGASGCDRKMSRPVPLYVTSSLDLSQSKRNVGSRVCDSIGWAVLRLVWVLALCACEVAPVDGGRGALAAGAELSSPRNARTSRTAAAIAKTAATMVFVLFSVPSFTMPPLRRADKSPVSIAAELRLAARPG